MFIAGVVVVDVYVDFNVAGGAAAIVFCCLHEKRTQNITIVQFNWSGGESSSCFIVSLRYKKIRQFVTFPIDNPYLQFTFLGSSHFEIFSLQM